MTHSTRKSYKDKYLALKSGIPDVSPAVEGLTDAARILAQHEVERKRQHEVIQELARAVGELVLMLDSSDGKLGYSIKDVSKPIDRVLDSLDGTLIVRRSRDVVLRAAERIGLASCGISELRKDVQELNMGAHLLTDQIVRTKHGYLESFVIGTAPSWNEIEESKDNRGKNPRTLDFDYTTDADDSDEDDSEDEVEEQEDNSLVVSALTAIAVRSGNGHKKIDSKNSVISIR